MHRCSHWSALVCTGLQLHAPSFLPLQHLWCPSKVTICLCTLAVHLFSLFLSASASLTLSLPKFIFQLHNTNTLLFIWRKRYHTFLIYHSVNLRHFRQLLKMLDHIFSPHTHFLLHAFGDRLKHWAELEGSALLKPSQTHIASALSLCNAPVYLASFSAVKIFALLSYFINL